LFAISSSSGSTFNVQLFVVNFNFSFSNGQQFRAGHYKIQHSSKPCSLYAIFCFASISCYALLADNHPSALLTLFSGQSFSFGFSRSCCSGLTLQCRAGNKFSSVSNHQLLPQPDLNYGASKGS
jgi:hypothetical protein